MNSDNIIIVLLELSLILLFTNGEICPAPCICKPVKNMPSTSNTKWLKADCKASKNKILSLEEIDLNSIASELVQLDLSENAISSLSSNSNLPMLQKLDLSQNKFNTLKRESFVNFVNLKRLDLSGNSIKYIDKDAFLGLKNLERLRLNGNLIASISKGTFDNLTSLKQLDISSNPLTCDCDLLWLIDWLQNKSIKLMTQPKCASPPLFKGQYLRKLKLGEEIHCKSPILNNNFPLIELRPDQNQIVFEGDSLKLRCLAPSITAETLGVFEDSNSKAQLVWKLDDEDPNSRFPDIKIENRYLTNSGLLDSMLTISELTRNHSGQWNCLLLSAKLNQSKDVSVTVISDETVYCPLVETTNNKGTYAWPNAISNNTVEQPCEGQQLSSPYSQGYASYYCSETGNWQHLNTSTCPFISETTKILEQFSKVNLNLTKGNLIESVKHLKNYTVDGKLLKDKMDIVFISRTVANYVDYVNTEKYLGGNLTEIVSYIMNSNIHLLKEAQIEDGACYRMVEAVQNVSKFTPQFYKNNLAVAYFHVKPDNFNGLACTWYRSKRDNILNRRFDCTTSTHMPYPNLGEVIEASVQIPPVAFYQLAVRGNIVKTALQLVVSMYGDGSLFPTFQAQKIVTSCVVGANLIGSEVENLTEPIILMYRYQLLQDELSSPVLARWDTMLNDNIGGWSKHDCNLSHYIHETLIFSCNRLGHFALLQNIEYAHNGLILGAKFHFSHPAIYVGTFILIFFLLVTIITYLLCYNSIQIAKRAKHSLINLWIAICLLTFLFTFGIYQTEDYELCQVVGIVLHYLTLSCLLWMCVVLSNMYKRLSKSSDSVTLPEDEIAPDQPIQKPILGLYLVGWGIALIICGISGAVNMREYASHSFCFLYSMPALNAIFVPAGILLTFLLIFFVLIRCAISRNTETHGQLSEGTQATENVDLDLLEPNTPNERISIRSVSTPTASSDIEDPEHSHCTQLKAHIIVVIIFVLMWTSAALTTRRIFKNIILYDDHIFSCLYAFLASLLGAFILFFYGVARSDVRTRWTFAKCWFAKKCWCRSRNISDTNPSIVQNVTQPLAPIPNQVAMEINNSRSSSRTSSHTKSHNSNILKAAADLNSSTLQDPLPTDAKIANVNLVVLHRQQYRTNNTLPIYSENSISGAEMFYNPHQSGVARKFFKRQRKNMMKHNNLGTRRSRGDGAAATDNSSIVSLPKNMSKNSARANINSDNIFGSGSKINNTNIHVEVVKEPKQQNKNILLNSGDDSDILFDQVSGPMNRLIAETQRQSLQSHIKNTQRQNTSRDNISRSNERRLKNSQSDESIKLNDLSQNCETSKLDNTRTVSQQCSLDYSSESPPDMRDDNVEKDEDATSNIENSFTCQDVDENLSANDEISDLEENLNNDENSKMQNDNLELNVTENDLIDMTTGDSSLNLERTESVRSHGLYPQMPHGIYINPLSACLRDHDGSTTTLDSEMLFTRYQPSEASAVTGSDCDDCEQLYSDRCSAVQSPVSASEIDELYEQISRPARRRQNHKQSPVLFPLSISLESNIENINTDYRFNMQGVMPDAAKNTSEVSTDSNSSLKKETTV